LNGAFGSLRTRLLVPLVAASVVAAGAVAAASYWLGASWASEDARSRFAGIRETLATSSFPLTETVLGSLAELTQTELITLDAAGRVLASTLPSGELRRGRSFNAADLIGGTAAAANGHPLSLAGKRYHAYSFRRAQPSRGTDRVRRVIVLFDDARLRAAGRRAALLPLATGLSTVVLLGSLALLLARRLVKRLTALERRVGRIAEGDFESRVADRSSDEIGGLGRAVDSMAAQLQQLWRAVEQKRSQELLHQIAGGMAHQLRNSLTGARMAVELHASRCADGDDESVRVSIAQIEQSEDYVRRLLLVASGKQDDNRPADVLSSLGDVRSGLQPIAKHLQVDLRWDLPAELARHRVSDGPTFSAAITNLVMNAMESGSEVAVDARPADPESVCVSVSDNGQGVPGAVADRLFEPFVTSKPQGLGLGLPLVRRAAEHLGGRVEWERQQGRTTFRFFTRAPATGNRD
jgi:hypothetical protein